MKTISFFHSVVREGMQGEESQDAGEISGISAFIASLSKDIPYALLAFHPHFMMKDLPPTSKRHAQECLAVAKAQELRNVGLGNIHLLVDYY